MHATLGGGAGRVWLENDTVHFNGQRASPLAYDSAAIAVNGDGHHRDAEPFAVIIQVQQSVDESMGQARLVQRLVGIGHVHTLVDESGGQQSGRLRMSFVMENLVRGFVPNVAPGRPVSPGEG